MNRQCVSQRNEGMPELVCCRATRERAAGSKNESIKLFLVRSRLECGPAVIDEILDHRNTRIHDAR